MFNKVSHYNTLSSLQCSKVLAKLVITPQFHNGPLRRLALLVGSEVLVASVTNATLRVLLLYKPEVGLMDSSLLLTKYNRSSSSTFARFSQVWDGRIKSSFNLLGSLIFYLVANLCAHLIGSNNTHALTHPCFLGSWLQYSVPWPCCLSLC